ncbi:MAG: hypothetical protein ASARMPRED_004602 [Alectoria sarmentosa]|nr:MAG: hypothetical protein ASARMPRED_004602 [Alectoria sarmentosa]
MPPPLNTNKFYEHLQRVEWPKDLPGPNYWIPDYTLLSGLPKAVKARVHNITTSGTRFYQKAKRLPAPMISADKSDPDAIHALKVALVHQDELENAIKPPNEHPADSLMLWLQERKRSLVKSMLAVVIAEEGEMYDEANRDPWEVKLVRMTDEHVEFLRFIFRTVMARIDIVPAENPNDEKIKPMYKEVVLQPGGGINVGIFFPPAPSVSFWKIDDSLMENATPKMRQAASALYHQGRVLTAARKNLPVIEQKPFPPVFDVTIRAMYLTIRSIDLVWTERKEGLVKEEEQRLLVWLLERKNAAVDLRLAFLQFHIPLELYPFTLTITNSGVISVLEKGEYSEWGRMFLL